VVHAVHVANGCLASQADTHVRSKHKETARVPMIYLGYMTFYSA